MILLPFLASAVIGCTHAPSPVEPSPSATRPVFHIVVARSPLHLDHIVLADTTGEAASPALTKEIDELIRQHDLSTLDGNISGANGPLRDAYLGTLKISGRQGVYYLVIMQQVPTMNMPVGKLFLWDEAGRRMDGPVIDLKLFALYDVVDGTLRPSNLKQHFNISGPELELQDTLGVEAVVLDRLWHNGTFNADERMVLHFAPGRVDTLAYRQRPL